MEVHQDFDLEIRSQDLVFTDLNSDGMEDVVSAFPNQQAGVVVVGWGSLDAGMVLGDSDSRLDAPFSSRGAFGWSLAAGDIDGDGSVDLVVGSPEHGAGAGRVDLYPGPFVSEASLQSMQPSVTFLGGPGAHLGAEVHVVPSDASAGVRLAVSSHQGFYLLTSPGD